MYPYCISTKQSEGSVCNFPPVILHRHVPSSLDTVPDEEEIINSLNTSSLSHHFQTETDVLVSLLSDIQFPNMRCRAVNAAHCECERLLNVLCVVSRLQGDTLSDSRSKEGHRPHISEQAVPDISCKFQKHLHF